MNRHARFSCLHLGIDSWLFVVNWINIENADIFFYCIVKAILQVQNTGNTDIACSNYHFS